MNKLIPHANCISLQASNPTVENVRKYLPFGLLALGIFLYSSFSIATAAPGGNGSNPKGRPFVSLAGEVVAVQGAISSLQDQIDILVARVDTVEQRVTADEVAVATLMNQMQALQALVNQNLTDITAIQNEVVGLQDQNTYLQSLIATNSGDIVALQAEVNANAALVTTLEQAVLLVQTNVINLGTSLQAQIDNNATLISALQDEINSINDALLFKQNLVNGICPDGSAVTQIMPSGSIVCGDITGGGGTTDQLVTVRSFSEITALPGRIANSGTDCPAGYQVTGYGYIYALGWDINNLANTLPNRGYIEARNNNSYTDSMFHVVACATVVPGV